MMTLNGFNIIESPHIQPVANMRVSPEFACIQSPELVASTNEWMREFFGTHLPMFIIGGDRFGMTDSIVAHPSQMAMLRAATVDKP